MSQRDGIMRRIQALPAMPVAAAAAMRILQDPDSTIEDVCRVVEHDAGLTSNVLKLANSALYGGSRTIGSVRDALVRLGSRRVSQLVVMSTASAAMTVPVQGYGLTAGQLWEHAVAVALATEALAQALRLPVPEWAFTVGILHDVGKIVLGTFVEVDAVPLQALAARERVSFDEAERQVLGVDHAEAGAVLLEAWQLPKPVVDAVRWHHNPDPGCETGPITDLVHAADVLCLAEGIGAGNDGLNYRLSSGAVRRLNLTTRVNEAVLCRVISALRDLREFFAQPGGR